MTKTQLEHLWSNRNIIERFSRRKKIYNICFGGDASFVVVTVQLLLLDNRPPTFKKKKKRRPWLLYFSAVTIEYILILPKKALKRKKKKNNVLPDSNRNSIFEIPFGVRWSLALGLLLYMAAWNQRICEAEGRWGWIWCAFFLSCCPYRRSG